jgi:hypothetical protein
MTDNIKKPIRGGSFTTNKYDTFMLYSFHLRADGYSSEEKGWKGEILGFRIVEVFPPPLYKRYTNCLKFPMINIDIIHIGQGIAIGKYPVTQAQYEDVMGYNPSYFNNPVENVSSCNNPVENVSYYDAVAFCEKLSAQTGREYRLPTTSEWEKACYAGKSTPIDLNELNNYAWYYGNSGNRTHPVGQLEPNSWGIYDMQGNVWEWCDEGEPAEAVETLEQKVTRLESENSRLESENSELRAVITQAIQRLERNLQEGHAPY